MTFMSTISFVAKAVIAGLALAFVAVLLRPSLLTGPASPRPAAVQPASYADAVEASAPAVVNIYATKRVSSRVSRLLDNPYIRQRFPQLLPVPRERTQNSLGSGVIIAADGYVVTNNHLIAGAEGVRVALNDGRVAEAELVGTDPDTDIALLRIPFDGLPTVTLGRSDTLRIGDVVLAIGNPFGIGQTVTQGIVSATGRGQVAGGPLFSNYIQTDASINPGNSGGALISGTGELVGLNTAIFSGDQQSEGIGFAIPVNLVRGVQQELIAHGRVIRGWIGVDAQTLLPELARSLGLGDARGVIITNVPEGTPADLAGLQAGDVLTAVDGQPVTRLQDALSLVASTKPGDTVGLTGLRNREQFYTSAIAVERQSQRGGYGSAGCGRSTAMALV